MDAKVISQFLADIIGRDYAAQAVSHAIVVCTTVKHTDDLFSFILCTWRFHRIVGTQFQSLFAPLASLLKQVLEHVLNLFACAVYKSFFS